MWRWERYQRGSGLVEGVVYQSIPPFCLERMQKIRHSGMDHSVRLNNSAIRVR